MNTVIFDMDGVIIDSERQWKLLGGPFFKGIIPRWRDEDHKKIVGLGVVDLYFWLVREYDLKEPKDRFLSQCETLAEEIYGRKTSPSAGLFEFIAELRGKGVALGLASSSPRAWIDITLSRFDLTKVFSAVVSGDDAPGKTKPAPDIYLLAAQKLGVSPKLCLAIEDSVLGVRAAKSAGMSCAGFRNGHNHEQDLSLADFEFESFQGLRYEDFLSKTATRSFPDQE